MPDHLSQEITEKVIQRMERSKIPILVNVSNRHFHCTASTFEKLFGAGRKPTKMRDLVQPGQYSCEETITIRGKKGEIKNVRLIAPNRSLDQVEISRTDCFVLGIDPPVRESGSVQGSSPITMIGPVGTVELKEGAIVALRHLHLHPSQAEKLGVKDKEKIRLKLSADTPRETIYTMICRVREDMTQECHLDTDEANAAGVKNGDFGILL